MRDQERACFVRDHYRGTPEDFRSFDLVMNTSRFSPDAWADLIADALDCLQACLAQAGHERLPAGH